MQYQPPNYPMHPGPGGAPYMMGGGGGQQPYYLVQQHEDAPTPLHEQQQKFAWNTIKEGLKLGVNANYEPKEYKPPPSQAQYDQQVHEYEMREAQRQAERMAWERAHGVNTPPAMPTNNTFVPPGTMPTPQHQ
ncbi:hypothetical protein CPB86DRAFT_786891 [Serendipita vermifera]|nr:hypothetical protein CPB86DRAFT_786891 [Serendipita vermifera]